jgi:hypothetical protein
VPSAVGVKKKGRWLRKERSKGERRKGSKKKAKKEAKGKKKKRKEELKGVNILFSQTNPTPPPKGDKISLHPLPIVRGLEKPAFGDEGAGREKDEGVVVG